MVEAQQRLFREAARHLCRGAAVAVPAPSGTALLASAFATQTLERMQKLASPTNPFTAVLTSVDQINGWLPDLEQRGRRLCRRCWPGEVAIRFTSGYDSGLLQQLPERSRQLVAAEGGLTAQVPVSSQVMRVAHMVPLPLVALFLPVDMDVSGLAAMTLPRTAQDEAPQPVARLEWDGNQVKVLDAGSFQPEQLNGLTDLVVLFLCSGNTCRSPLAEAMCKTLLAEQLGCKKEELPQRGVHVLSAGLGAGSGSPAAPEAVSAGQAYGADLSQHASQPLSMALLQDADYIFAMTGQHLRTLHGRVPAGTVLEPLAPDGNDVQDPYGASQVEYNACAVEIYQHLQAHLPRLMAEILTGGAAPQTSSSAGGGA